MDVPSTSATLHAPAVRSVDQAPLVGRRRTVSGSRPVPAINRRARWPGFAVFLLAMGGLSIGLGVAAGTVPASVQPPPVQAATGRRPGVGADDREVPARCGVGRSGGGGVMAAAAAAAAAGAGPGAHRRIRRDPGRHRRIVVAAGPLGAVGQGTALGCVEVPTGRSGGRGLVRDAGRGAGSARRRAGGGAVDTAALQIRDRSPSGRSPAGSRNGRRSWASSSRRCPMSSGPCWSTSGDPRSRRTVLSNSWWLGTRTPPGTSPTPSASGCSWCSTPRLRARRGTGRCGGIRRSTRSRCSPRSRCRGGPTTRS